MASRNRPYIGITDFSSLDQVIMMRRHLDELGSNRLLAVGVMMSYKTLHGIPTRWASVFPPPEVLRSVFHRRPGVLNVLHYADYENQSTIEDWLKALECAGSDVDAIQFDMIWPNPHTLYEFKKRAAGRGMFIKFIIQVSEMAMEIEGNSQIAVADRLVTYDRLNCLDYVLFDMSGGKGKPMSTSLLSTYVGFAAEAIPGLSVAIAGGLGPASMNLAEIIVRDWSADISLDAQSKLRPSADAMDPIDWDLARAYLTSANALCEKYSD